jgi:hypothetical protein
MARSRQVPTFEEWLALTESERAQIQAGWNAYGGEGAEIVARAADDFRAKFGHLPGLSVSGPGVYHGGSWVIAAMHPFVFDRRTIPESHLGIGVHASIGPELPREFEASSRKYAYVWAPPHYEAFVDGNTAEIRQQLGNPSMSRDEMLSALVGRPFDEFLQSCREHVSAGRIEPFE